METFKLLLTVFGLSAFLFSMVSSCCDEHEHRLKFYAGALLLPIIIGSYPLAKHLVSDVLEFSWTVVYYLNNTVGDFLASVAMVSVAAVLGAIASVMIRYWLRDPIYG